MHSAREYLRRLHHHAHAGGLQGLGDRHGDLFGQPLLNCNTMTEQRKFGRTHNWATCWEGSDLTLQSAAVDLNDPGKREHCQSTAAGIGFVSLELFKCHLSRSECTRTGFHIRHRKDSTFPWSER